MNSVRRHDEIKETATVLAFLAYMMNNPPDEAFLEKLRNGYKNDLSDNADVKQFWQKYKNSEDSKIVQDLAAEWARLFRGTLPDSGQKPPYAGVFIAKDGLGIEIMLALKYMYDVHGFIPAKQDRMDYMGIILDFAAGLLGSYALYVEKGQIDEANSCLATLKEVCDNYLTPWVEAFVNQTLANTKNPLYREYMFTLLETVSCIPDILE